MKVGQALDGAQRYLGAVSQRQVFTALHLMPACTAATATEVARRREQQSKCL